MWYVFGTRGLSLFYIALKYFSSELLQDAYFYSLVYDPVNQTLLADKGKIEIGSKTQANIPNLITDDADEKNIEDLNEQKYFIYLSCQI